MWHSPQFPTDLVTFTEEILNEKLNFLCSKATWNLIYIKFQKKFLGFWVFTRIESLRFNSIASNWCFVTRMDIQFTSHKKVIVKTF